MADFLLYASAFVLVMVALGLVGILRGPANVDRMMAAQLFGTGGIAALLLLGAATNMAAVVDVALVLAILAAFASIAFVQAGESAQAASTAPPVLLATGVADTPESAKSAKPAETASIQAQP